MSPWRAPSLPIAVLLLVAPVLAVAQFRALAPAITVTFLLVIVAHFRAHRRLPWPTLGPVAGLGTVLLGWCAVSAAWAPAAGHALQTTGSLAALFGLGLMAARAVAADASANLRRMGSALLIGLAIGVALLLFDQLSGHWFRLAVRGFPRDVPFIGFGLKPALSFFVALLPLALMVPVVPMAARVALVAAGLGVAFLLPADAAALAALAGVGVAVAALALPRLVPRVVALSLAAFVVAAPLIFGAVLTRGPDVTRLPFSAQHRVLIWDFVGARIAERPLAGWGMESARAIPGGTERFPPETLARFGVTTPGQFASTSAQRLPLHPHNAALQVWLELGLVGAVLAAALVGVAIVASGPVAVGAAASAAVTAMLSFGAWQPWWIAVLMLVGVVAAGLRPLLVPPGAGEQSAHRLAERHIPGQ